MAVPTRAECARLDDGDPLASYRAEFVIEDDALIYFDGNSLGRLPKATVARVNQVLTAEWGGSADQVVARDLARPPHAGG